VLLRPLPFAHAEQLVSLAGLDSARQTVPTVSSMDWLDWQKATSVETALYGFSYRQTVVTSDSAIRVNADHVSDNYFTVLGARFAIGRGFSEDEIRSDGATVAVISERLWRTMFGGDSSLSATLRTPVGTYRVIGVVARGGEFPAGTDIWFPSALTPSTDPSRIDINWTPIGRLAAGATADRAAAELSAIVRSVRAADPSAIYDYGVTTIPLSEQVVGGADDYLRLLMGVVIAVLLIVCANVAAAGLARGAARRHEMAVRTSIGAGRMRLVQQLLVEHLCLGFAGGALGLLLAWAGTRAILWRWGAQIPRAAEISIDGRVFAFTLAVALVAGALAGVLPAIRVSRIAPNAVLASGSRTSVSGGRGLAGAWLVGAEIALALVLLTGAGLLVRSFRSLLGRGVGIDTNVATVNVPLGGPRYATDSVRRAEYLTSLVDTYRAMPGVRAVGLTSFVPLGLTGQGFVDIEGQSLGSEDAVYRVVNGGFFAAMGLHLFIGRVFGPQDGAATSRVVVINRKMASMYWPGQNPIGRRVRARSMERKAQGPADWLTIIGVVSDLRTYGLESDLRPEMYTLYTQVPSWTHAMTALVRGIGSSRRLLPELRRRARAIDPHVGIDTGTIDELLSATLAPRVLTMSLLTTFAVVAVLLAAFGIYGVLSYSVAQRTRELAVRAALGADRRRLLMLVATSGFRVVLAGGLAGLIAAFWLTRSLTTMLVDVTPTDPLTVALAALTLFVVASFAIAIPALRATRLNPMIALQGD
jgi:putative ABC transport system permease protein